MPETIEVQNETRANLSAENANGDSSLSLRAKLLARRAWLPSWRELGAALLSALLLTLAFPDFDLWFVAWFALVPLLVVIAQGKASEIKGFLLGWLAGTIFFYASCWWLTYSSIHYGGFPAPLAYALLILITAIVGIFPAFAIAVLARACRRWGVRAMLLAAPIWTTFEWLRFVITNQLWNAVGYSQSFKPVLIQVASFGGVFAVGFLIVVFNSALALLVINQSEIVNATSGNANENKRVNNRLAFVVASIVALVVSASWIFSPPTFTPNVNATMQSGGVVTATQVDASQVGQDARAVLFAIQPNIAIKMRRPPAEFEGLTQQHFAMSREAMRVWESQATGDIARNLPRIIIFPESPMNFAYGNDTRFRQVIGDFAREMNAAILFNSQEPDRRGGVFNAAVLVDRRGNYVAQYDKMQLLPFGEYVPAWLPGSGNLSSLVGNFTRGVDYSLLPVGGARAGVFICIESAFPEIARNMTRAGADVLINISNDAYLGDTPVARQHLANSIFRAVENRRPVIRVTNTGVSTYITASGETVAPTETFVPAVQTWLVKVEDKHLSLYTRGGDFFIFFTLFVTLMTLVFSFIKTRLTSENQ